MNLSRRDLPELLRLYANIQEELRNRGIARSTNNPVADFTEYLVSKKLHLTLTPNSVAGYDATDARGNRYQIKGRRPTPQNPSTELSAIRKLDEKPFDFLIAVVYKQDFEVDYGAKLPYNVVRKLAKYSAHTNAHRFHMRRSILDDKRITDITRQLLE